jgi:hypothetical protein
MPIGTIQAGAKCGQQPSRPPSPGPRLRRRGPADPRSRSLTDLGLSRALALQPTGDYPAAGAALFQAQAIYRALGNRYREVFTCSFLASLQRLTGDYPAAAASSEMAVRELCDIGDRSGRRCGQPPSRTAAVRRSRREPWQGRKPSTALASFRSAHPASWRPPLTMARHWPWHVPPEDRLRKPGRWKDSAAAICWRAFRRKLPTR